MSYTMTGAVAGAAITGFTAPTYTLTADTSADDNTRQSAVTALGGTQAGVLTHSVSQPFTVRVTRPRSLRVLGKANLNGFIANVGRNTYGVLVRKGVLPLAGQPYQIAIARLEFEIPAGSEIADSANIKGLCSFIGGFLSANAQGIVDTVTSAIL